MENNLTSQQNNLNTGNLYIIIIENRFNTL